MVRVLSMIILMLAAALRADVASAEPRVALVIGNGDYRAVLPLDNPASDATLMADTLERLGFTVTRLIESDLAQMRAGIASFGRDLRAAGPEATGLFYYAGHGLQSFGTNYLLPVDAQLSNAADLDLAAVEAQSILRQMSSARNRTNLVILDACRNNPFEDLHDLDDNGLAEMKAPTGTFLAYATAPGAVALDGLDGNSPFTAALVAEMASPGLPVEQVFKQVRVRVIDETGGRQTPWDASSLTSDFAFVAETRLSQADLEAQQLWRQLGATRDPVQIMLFLRAYPDSAFDAEARGLLSEVMAGELAAAPGDPAPADPVPADPALTEEERALIDRAQGSGALADYQAYLDRFPAGVFAEFARSEVASLRSRTAAAAAPATVAPGAEPAAADGPPVRFDEPLVRGSEAIRGQSLAELILGSPLFPPIEGLPAQMWQDQQCSSCHSWTREALCTQARTYLGQDAQRSMNKDHPYGGSFKQNLKTWAEGDCD